MRVYDLTDVLRSKNPDARQFPCHSFRAMSHIDLSFATSITLPLISTATILPCGISDHAPLLLEIDRLRSHGPPLWCLNSHWLEDQTIYNAYAWVMKEF